MNAAPHLGLYRLKTIIGDPKAVPPIPPIVPVSKTTWYEWCARKVAPAPVHVGGMTFWRASDVIAFAGGASANDPAHDHDTAQQGGR